jgi:hypothetical protein
MNRPKKVAILQSNYIPWKGYFDIIASVDLFIILDSVQYTKNDWRNRNKIKTPAGIKWITIPVKHSHLGQPINDVNVADTNWALKHWKTLYNNYCSAPGFKDVSELFEDIYLRKLPGKESLSDINAFLLREICKLLQIPTEIVLDSDFDLSAGRVERLVDLCKKAGASEYLSGPAAKSYIDEDRFKEAGIIVSWADYSNYKAYEQLYPPFDHYLSIVDLLFNTGAAARNYLKTYG